MRLHPQQLPKHSQLPAQAPWHAQLHPQQLPKHSELLFKGGAMPLALWEALSVPSCSTASLPSRSAFLCLQRQQAEPSQRLTALATLRLVPEAGSCQGRRYRSQDCSNRLRSGSARASRKRPVCMVPLRVLHHSFLAQVVPLRVLHHSLLAQVVGSVQLLALPPLCCKARGLLPLVALPRAQSAPAPLVVHLRLLQLLQLLRG